MKKGSQIWLPFLPLYKAMKKESFTRETKDVLDYVYFLKNDIEY